MLRSAASPGSVGFGRFGGGTSGLLMTPLPTGHLHLDCSRNPTACGKMQKAPSSGAPLFIVRARRLLDLGFPELDVLLGDGVVLLLHELVRHGARVLARHIIESGVGAGNQLDLDGCGLGHGNPRWRELARNLMPCLPMSMCAKGRRITAAPVYSAPA